MAMKEVNANDANVNVNHEDAEHDESPNDSSVNDVPYDGTNPRDKKINTKSDVEEEVNSFNN